MAKVNLKNISIKNLLSLSDDEILNLANQGIERKNLTKEEFAKEHRNNLANITSRLVSAANKRIVRLGKSKIGQSSPSYQQAKKSLPDLRFSVRGKNWNQVRNTLKEVKEWLNYKTSTIKGWKEVRANIRENVGMDFDSEYKSKKFWEVYRRLYESNSGLITRKGSSSRLSSDRIQKMLAQTITQKSSIDGKRIDWRSSINRILENAQANFDNEYRIAKLSDNDDIGSSRYFFGIDDEEE